MANNEKREVNIQITDKRAIYNKKAVANEGVVLTISRQAESSGLVIIVPLITNFI